MKDAREPKLKTRACARSRAGAEREYVKRDIKMLPTGKRWDVRVAPKTKRQRQEAEFDSGSNPIASDIAPFLPDQN